MRSIEMTRHGSRGPLRGAAAWILLVAGALAASALGCDSGYTQDEADATCQGLVGQVDTASSAAYDDCVACFLECGDDCAMAESNPPQFTCPE